MHPIYLPEGKICFISTRCQYGILCDGPDNFTTTVLYRIDPDGSNMEKLSNSALSESNPSVMGDGRILYTRWEYIDKGAVAVKCLWAMRPDGTNPVEIYGNDVDLPPALLMGRQIPGQTNLFSCLGTPHCCPENGVGTVLTINTRKDIRTREPMHYITPNTDIRSENGISQFVKGEWIEVHSGPVYCDPFPLSENNFWLLIILPAYSMIKRLGAYICLMILGTTLRFTVIRIYLAGNQFHSKRESGLSLFNLPLILILKKKALLLFWLQMWHMEWREWLLKM